MTTLRKAWALFPANQRRTAVWIFALGLVGMILEILATAMVVPVLSLAETGSSGQAFRLLGDFAARFGFDSDEQRIVFAVTALAGVFVIKNLFLAYYYWEEARFVFGFQAQLSERLFAVYLRQPYTFHLQRNSALLLRNVIGEVANFNVVLAQTTTLVTELLVLVGMGTLLILFEPIGAMVVLVILSSTALAFHFGTRSLLYKWGKARQTHDGLRIKQLNEALGSIKDVKLLGREDDFRGQYGLHNDQTTRAARNHNTLKHLPRLWLETLVVAGIVALVLSLLSTGKTVAQVIPTLALFAAAAFRLMPSANRVISAIQSLRYGLPVVDTLYDELNAGAEAPEPVPSARRPFTDRIALEHVTYRYEGSDVPAVEDISMVIAHGETVGFVGPSGSGKTTLIDIILGLLPHDSGRVLIDGHELGPIVRAWQDQIGYVPQSIYLTDDTLRRNVAFGIPADTIDDQAVRRAIRAARLEQFVAALPLGLETIVGERGVRLSGGQRQRVGIARALYHDPSVLVLDEATSALDTATEREFMREVMEMHGAKTIIIVAHRLSTVEQCDRLYRLDHGRIVEEGAPAVMLETRQWQKEGA